MPRMNKSRFIDSSYDAWIELNLENMGHNLDLIRHRTRVPVMAVVKANAYGHGVEEVGRYLDEKGIAYLLVCKLQEAVRLRDAGVTCPIYNFGPFAPEDAEVLVEREICQAVYSEKVQFLAQAALRAGKTAQVQVHIDAGMGRVGIPYREALPFLENVASLEGVHLAGVSMTLTEGEEFDRVLLERFLSLCREAEGRGIDLGLKHAASSSGIQTAAAYYLDMVRPGIVLYGYYPSDKAQREAPLDLRPVLQLKSRVIAVKTLKAGDSVSYRRAYVAQKQEKFAVVSIGYSDGYPVEAVGRGFVLIRGERQPIIARVTANHIEVLFDLDSPVEVGDEVVLVGAQGAERITAEEVARWGGVTVYQFLIRLSPYLPRKIIGHG